VGLRRGVSASQRVRASRRIEDALDVREQARAQLEALFGRK